MHFTFENLVVYQRSIDFANEAISGSRGFPTGFGHLGNQLSRAAISIAANIVEGTGRFTRSDRKRFLGIARGSVHECVALMAIARRQELVSRGEHERARVAINEMGKMLNGLIRSIDEESES